MEKADNIGPIQTFSLHDLSKLVILRQKVIEERTGLLIVKRLLPQWKSHRNRNPVCPVQILL